VQRAERLAGIARRLGTETRTRLDAESDSLLRSAATATGSSESSLFQLVELLEKATDAELSIADADTAVRAARAELWRYGPADAFRASFPPATP
jgi:outer membrane protein, heavy metal efflux system